ncbi:thermonuclease family protein [Paragemmobacter straminiformis]|uniref:Thermonuclease family protein n=1 Tax=Paragemmobacter straminiformis TaxID=2045119 RepID=A0A842I492_9RHOB|nr:thermonuclease family protein [Gemmobacter straminiformis]MBC2834335.1 thermonuclease family protein [Gemmobacter straminiformis]
MALIIRSLLVLILCGFPAFAETIVGRARVIDGDTLEIGSKHVRLFGIDAPEHDQTCDRNGKPWPCGQAAAQALADLAGRARLECEVQDRDRYGRAVSICAAKGVDLGEQLVRQGTATAYLRYSHRYVAAEAEAKARRLGIWGGQMVTPEDYRHGTAQDAPDPSCTIKGNIGTKGRVYHMAGQADYAATRINESKGERWFCSEAQARAAGFRKASR